MLPEIHTRKANAIGDFRADAGKFDQLRARVPQREFSQRFEIDFPGAKSLCRGAKVWGAKTKFARAQVGLVQFRNPRETREGVC